VVERLASSEEAMKIRSAFSIFLLFLFSPAPGGLKASREGADSALLYLLPFSGKD